LKQTDFKDGVYPDINAVHTTDVIEMRKGTEVCWVPRIGFFI
jgi:hypothetical protein